MSEHLYHCENIHFCYRLGTQEIWALKGVNFLLPRGQMVCLAGPSGSGKTTLLNLLGLIERPQNGQIFFNGQYLGKIREKERNRIRRFEMGHIFQHFNLLNALTAYENVEYFLIRQNVRPKERAERVEDALRQVGLWDQRQQSPLAMSGGQQQRVAIARALAKRPVVMIADEPTASLDQDNGREIMSLLGQLQRQHGISVVLSSHDPMVLSSVSVVIPLIDGTNGTNGKISSPEGAAHDV